MLTIGSKRPAASQDVVDLLLECHARIRSFCDLAVRLAEASRPSPAEIVDAAERVRRYFAEALPLHAQDEEESILPRLAGRDPDVDQALVDMHREHREHEPMLERLLALTGELARAPERHEALAPELGRVARALRGHFDLHLSGEERLVFPAIRALVPEAERRTMLEELRARRAAR
jgi:iron-sulfur cluster repair protein YtfE (RIC family)